MHIVIVKNMKLLGWLEVGRLPTHLLDLLGNLPYSTEAYYERGMNIHVGLHYARAFADRTIGLESYRTELCIVAWS